MSEITGIKFRPVMGPEEVIKNTVQSNGWLYVATDTGNMYLDVNNHRISIGGAGGSGGGSTGFSWADGDDTTIIKASGEEDDDTTLYLIDVSIIEDGIVPKPDSLILNSDGRFFRVMEINSEGKIVANLIAVSGSGGGGGGTVQEKDIELSYNERSIKQSGSIFIAGQEYYAIFIPAAIGSNTDTSCWLRFTVSKNGTMLKQRTVDTVRSGSQYKFDTSWLPIGTGLTLTVTVGSPNSEYKGGQGRDYNFTGISVVEMSVEEDSTMDYIPIVRPDAVSRTINLRYKPMADINLALIQHVYVDDIEIPSLRKELQPSTYNSSVIVAVPGQSHGVHNVSFRISSIINDTEMFSNTVTYQAAWAEQGNESPIIWIGKYDKEIVNYETSYIEFMVFDPVAVSNSMPANIILYKENVEVGQMDVSYSDTEYAKWDISTIYEVGENTYSIVCKSARANIENYVTTVGSRDLGLVDEEALMLNFSTAGRSNNEVSSQRQIFKDKKNNVQAILNGFNWKNNGWNNDGLKNGIDNGSYLTIANGASLTIPFQTVVLNSNTDYTIEMRYRIKNVQKYSTLVKSYAKYYINVGTEANPVKSSVSYTMAELKQMAITQGVDSIPLFYDEYGSPVMDDKVSKEWEKVDGVVCKWMQGNNGLCIGTQEAYFASPRGVVSVRYKEDEVINISINISQRDNLCYIYLNGILSGADSLPPAGDSGKFTITSNFEINSEYCDIDLYRFRVYQSGLSMPQVIHNYLSDIHSIVLYDQNQLTLGTAGADATKLAYQKLIQYNEQHPEALTMPYAVIKIISDNKKTTDGVEWAELLPYYKGNKCTCEVTFVNPSLDQALEDGAIDEWYYYTHCPSYRAVGVDIDVQGTSSQGYPRRNYKTKFKSAAPSDKHPEYGWFYTKGSLAGKRVDKGGTVTQTQDGQHKPLGTPVERTVAKKYHMDNEALGTNKFTWKIDYMESSGTYNTGYANLMGNTQHPLYTQHPLDYYNISTVSTEGLRTSVYGFPVLTFHEYENGQNNPSAAGQQYEYIGRYNINLDKSSNEYYGFEIEKEQPYIDQEWDEMGEREATDPNTGEPILGEDGKPVMEEYVKAHHMHPWISQIAECWELSDNQGTWCSWRFPTAAARTTGFRTLQTGYNDRYEMMLHFEYRYSPYGDQLDAIGADGNYDGSASERAKFADEIGTTHLQMSEYAYDKYKNLEAVFKWLDSTDQENAPNTVLQTPLTIQTPRAYNGEGETSIAVTGYAMSDQYDSSKDYYLFENDNYVLVQKYLDEEHTQINTTQWGKVETYEEDGVTKTRVVDGFKEGLTYYIETILYYNTTFEKDSKGYRVEKFRREFDQHLNKEYCLIYYVMTELLLCYDSRGKNMMFASFGPTANSNGNYVWFPIFYDIDTQLGLNNSGAYLWDYDADVSKDGLFSTPTSVLWVNLWDAFAEEIKGKYRALRGLDDKTNVVGSLSYENIAGAYTCDSSVFDSYAMKGIRPTIAIGLDEYYKYFATTASSGIGYFDTDGFLVKEDSPTFAYACQGDKILTTELLLRNRLNYIDSWWLGGDYDIKKVKGGQLQLRVSGNRATLTSDKYLHTVPAGLENTYTQKNFPTNPEDYTDPYDSHPGYKLKPFLKQYVSYFTDEVPGEPKAYTAGEGQENGVWTNIPESTITAYASTPETPNEQLNYIPGLDYLSSLGDLSTSYVSEFILRKGKRLLDLILGSDAPGYKNEMISSNTIFNLSMSKNDSGYKPLMKKMVFTGLESLDKTIDVSGSAKLQEFRALNTRIPNLYLADGAPLHTLHLPNTIRSLSLIENNELKNIIETIDPEVGGPNVWDATSPDDYKGLYIKGLTDATTPGSGHTLEQLIVDGGGLGYDAYKLLEKYVMVKTIPANENDPNAGDKVRIGMLNQQWTPYVQVEKGEGWNSSVQYYILNDHNMFETWSFVNAADWDEKTLNGVLYTRDEAKWAKRNTIQDLSLLDKFLAAFDAATAASTPMQPVSSKWGTKDDAAGPSVPTITGTIYVDNENGTAINEVSLTDTYKVRWPNLTITAANIRTANLSKYVRSYETGREETLTIERTGGTAPVLPSIDPPTLADYDFKGWSTTDPYKGTAQLALAFNPNYQTTAEMYTKTEVWNSLAFDENTTVITFYAVFEPHPYSITFKYIDGTIIDVVDTPFGEAIRTPSTVPHMDESDLPLERKYAFLGYNYNQDATEPIDMTTQYASKNTTMFAIFEEVSVYEMALDRKYLTLLNITIDGRQGYAIGLNNNYTYSGKITLPSWLDEKPILRIIAGETGQYQAQTNGISWDGGWDAYSNKANSITHIFWDTQSGNPQLLEISDNAFRGCQTLTYVEIPATVRQIGEYAFYCSAVQIGSTNARIINNSAFRRDADGIYASGVMGTFTIGPNTTFIGPNAFQLAPLEHLTIGSPEAESQLETVGSDAFKFCSRLTDITIYTNDSSKPVWASLAATATSSPQITYQPV